MIGFNPSCTNCLFEYNQPKVNRVQRTTFTSESSKSTTRNNNQRQKTTGNFRSKEWRRKRYTLLRKENSFIITEKDNNVMRSTVFFSFFFCCYWRLMSFLNIGRYLNDIAISNICEKQMSYNEQCFYNDSHSHSVLAMGHPGLVLLRNSRIDIYQMQISKSQVRSRCGHNELCFLFSGHTGTLRSIYVLKNCWIFINDPVQQVLGSPPPPLTAISFLLPTAFLRTPPPSPHPTSNQINHLSEVAPVSQSFRLSKNDFSPSL